MERLGIFKASFAFRWLPFPFCQASPEAVFGWKTGLRAEEPEHPTSVQSGDV